MCDTLVMRNGDVTLFGKNSDREPEEPQYVVRHNPVDNDKTAKVKTTWIEIPQTADRYGIILSKPSWIWGAEMGANDQGVVIGNTAVFTKVQEKEDGLIGMDLLRLGLERSASAREAVDVISSLLEKYGQGGICGLRDQSLRYDNSFVILDAKQIWILETAGRHWVARQVESWSTSNCLTLGEEYDLKSEGLEDFARSKKLFRGRDALDFAATFDTRFVPYFARSHKRVQTSRACLASDTEADAGSMMQHLRSHQIDSYSWFARRNSDLCMHAAGYVRRSQSCGSMVSSLSPDRDPMHFLTGTSAPCVSLFKPASLHDDGSVFLKESTTRSLWHRHEPVHQRALFDADFRKRLHQDRNETEKEIVRLLEADTGNIKAADQLAQEWQDRWEQEAGQYTGLPATPYGRFWRRVVRNTAS